MTYTIYLREKDIATLLNLIKGDFENSYEDATNEPFDNEQSIKYMEEDIDLLSSVSHAFKNDNAQDMLELVLADFRQKLRSLK